MSGCIQDRNIDWARKRVYRNVGQMAGLVSAATGPISAGAGAATITAIAGGVAGMYVAAATDVIEDFIPFPADYDVKHPSYWRCWWAHSTAVATKTWTPTLKYSKIASGAAVAAGTTALDTAIAQDLTNGTSKALQKTAWGKINANKFGATDLPKFLSVYIVGTGTAATTATMYFLGYEFEYTPHKCYASTGGKVLEAGRRVA